MENLWPSELYFVRTRYPQAPASTATSSPSKHQVRTRWLAGTEGSQTFLCTHAFAAAVEPWWVVHRQTSSTGLLRE
ncbi:hypothetical protein DUNSADRAFT_15401 [Dunaliella salina]|uniref:Encoded protein n=1 Tax=Dunaliella salina TaxID=3046 RepID=A0ABQ7G5I4_DUNSA|nr:hypothetical protein DUNSADRAFT_15401 [Dunaliella salina]|eukprot:KAF5829864.1 hypothetical protein DUNSADRAFT_15401 [Dunaliella salina]